MLTGTKLPQIFFGTKEYVQAGCSQSSLVELLPLRVVLKRFLCSGLKAKGPFSPVSDGSFSSLAPWLFMGKSWWVFVCLFVWGRVCVCSLPPSSPPPPEFTEYVYSPIGQGSAWP